MASTNPIKQAFPLGKLLNNRYLPTSVLSSRGSGIILLATDTIGNQQVTIRILAKPAVASNVILLNEGVSSSTVYGPTAVGDADKEIALLNQHITVSSKTLLNDPAPFGRLLAGWSTPGYTFMVFEYQHKRQHSNIRSMIESGRRGPRTFARSQSLIIAILEDAIYNHDDGIFHCDIRPDNISVSCGGKILFRNTGRTTMDEEPFLSKTAVEYMTPEAISNNGVGRSPRGADCWALGITLLVFLYGRAPWAEASSRDANYKAYAEKRANITGIYPEMSLDALRVVLALLNVKPRMRKLGASLEYALAAKTFHNVELGMKALGGGCDGGDC